MNKIWHIFSDFDGTIARNDVGAQLFIQYGDVGKCREAVTEWMRGNISSREMYRRECATAELTPSQLFELAGQQKIDPHFIDFYRKCCEKEYDTTILSDGFQIYITQIFRRYDLLPLEIKANDIRFVNGRQIEPQFPHNDHSCGRCANCKGYHIREFKKNHPDAGVLFIGDGYSDRCGALEANIIFAKDDLLGYCKKEKINHISFESFADVIQNCQALGILH